MDYRLLVRVMVISVKSIYIVIIVLCLSLIANGQNRLILRKGLKKSVLVKGMKVMPLLNDDTASYSGWNNICKPCISLPEESIWILDSIEADGNLHFGRVISYKYDTIVADAFKDFSKLTRRDYRKNWSLDSVFYNKEGRSVHIYKKPFQREKQSFNIESIKTLKFATAQSCDKDFRNTSYILIGLGTLAILGTAFGYGSGTYTGLQALGYIISEVGLVLISLKAINSSKVKTHKLSEWKMKIR